MPCSEAKIPISTPTEEAHMNIFGSIKENGPSFHSKQHILIFGTEFLIACSLKEQQDSH